MDNREGWDIHQVLWEILILVVGIFSGLLLREYLRRRKGKRGGVKRAVKKR